MPMKQPLYVHAPGRELFAWLHRPARGSMASIGILICKPCGHESLCAHRSIRSLAAAAAELGFPVLSFDYAGTGDSDDVAADANQLDVWSEDIVAAAGELRRRSGVTRVILLGLRLGAVLATLAAARNPAAFEGLIAIAPVIDGRRYLRELRAASLAAEALTRDSPATAQGLEALGATLTHATLDGLATVELETQPQSEFAHALIIDREDLPTARSWSERLTQLGVRTRYVSLPGTVEMLMTGTTHHSIVPEQIVATVRRWLAQWQSAGSEPSDASVPTGDPLECDPLECDPMTIRLARLSAPTVGLTERPMWLRVAATSLFGIVTEPAAGERRRRGVILLNSGADHHIGPNRLYVSLARTWSGHGYVVLRLDLAGIGDSAPRPGQAANEVFPPEAMSDVAAALQYLRDRYGLREVTVAGVCSGAYHAIRAAISGLSFDRALLVNPQNFNWKPGMKLDTAKMIAAVSSAAVLGRPISAHHWRLLFSGRIDVLRVLRIIWRRLRLEGAAFVERTAVRLHLRTSANLGKELETLAARGVGLVFVFSRGDGGDRLLHLLAGPALDRLGERCRIHLIDSADHGFSRSASRQSLLKTLSDELFTPRVRRA
jgi:pimeloyl-ACP methyl ester carboxylesterase